jgi:hypothetical protein
MESITDYLIKENLELRKQLKVNYQLEQSNEEGEVGSRFYLVSRDPLLITGILISEGLWKNVKFSYNEMKEALSQFIGKPILVNHGNDPEYKDRIVGKITKVTPNDTIKALAFEGEVTDEQAIKDIMANKFDAVSISGSFDEVVKDDDGISLGKGFMPIEVSLTPSPACKRCLIFTANEIGLSMPEPEKYKCDICNKVFDTEDELMKHKEECKMNKPEDANELEKPMPKPEEVVKKVYVCPFCDKEFDTKEACLTHIKTEEKYPEPYETKDGYGKPEKYPEKVEATKTEPQATIVTTIVPAETPLSENVATVTGVYKTSVEMTTDTQTPTTAQAQDVKEQTKKEEPIKETTKEIADKVEAKPESVAPTESAPVKQETVVAKVPESVATPEPDKKVEVPQVVVTPTMQTDAEVKGERRYTIDEALEIAAKDGTLVDFAAQLFLDAMKKRQEDRQGA